MLKTIFPFKDERGIWVFDDNEFDLVLEPFVGDTNKLIDQLAAGIPNAERGFSLAFSDKPFNNAKMFQFVKEHEGGAYYTDGETTGWLCPVMFEYFDTCPERIYARGSIK